MRYAMFYKTYFDFLLFKTRPVIKSINPEGIRISESPMAINAIISSRLSLKCNIFVAISANISKAMIPTASRLLPAVAIAIGSSLRLYA